MMKGILGTLAIVLAIIMIAIGCYLDTITTPITTPISLGADPDTIYYESNDSLTAILDMPVYLDMPTLFEELSCDSIGCYIWAPGKAYTSPTLARIWEHIFDPQTNSNWTTRDTFFFQDSLFGDPYLLLASYLQVPDSLVCTMVTFQNGILSIPTGRIYYDSTFTSNSFAIIVDTVDHPFFQQSFLKRCE